MVQVKGESPDLMVSEAFVPLWDINSGYEHFAFHGGRGGGKSHGIAEPTVAHMCQREERVVCGRQFQNSIKDSVKELLEQKIQKMGMAVYFKSTDRELINVSTGSRATFIGMDRNPESAKSLEGCTLFWGDEAQAFTNRSIEIILPTIRAPGSRFAWSWNPRFRDDAVDDLFRGKAPPEKSYIREVHWYDNPYFYQTRMPSERRRMLRGNPKRYKHVWDGGYDENPDSAIFDTYSVGRPRREYPFGDVHPLYGMDFGFGSDPNVIVKVYIFEEWGMIYVAAEAVGYKVANRNIPDLIDLVPGARHALITADSARPETIEALNSSGLMVVGARKGAGSVKNGINFLQGYHLLIDPDCPITYEEVRNYKWKEDPNGRPMPIPLERQQDHCIDSIRYAVEEHSTNDALLNDNDSGGVFYL